MMVTTTTIRIVAWLNVMTTAIMRCFQHGRVSSTPMIRFMASMIETNTLDDSQRIASRPKEIRPVGGCS